MSGVLLFSIIGIAVAALILYSFKPGGLRMSRLTVLAVTADGQGHRSPRLLVRNNLFGARKEGFTVGAMHAKIFSKSQNWTLDTWEVGDPGKTISGPGLRVPGEGLEANHHFSLSSGGDSESCEFKPGHYYVEIHGALAGEKSRLLRRAAFMLTEESAFTLNEMNYVAAIFIWNPQVRNYQAKLAPATLDNLYTM